MSHYGIGPHLGQCPHCGQNPIQELQEMVGKDTKIIVAVKE